MATFAQVKTSQLEPKATPAENALFEAFEDLLETMTPEARKGMLKDLRANAEAHGE
jgi:hypothetical protein